MILTSSIATAELALEASKLLLSLLGGELQFSKEVRVDLTPTPQDLLRVVPKEDLFQSNIELLHQCLVITRRGADARGRKVEEISRLEHELVEASSSLKQSLEANSAFKGKMAGDSRP